MEAASGAAGIRGGVESEGAVDEGRVGQLAGLGSRFMWEEDSGAAVAGATAVDMAGWRRQMKVWDGIQVKGHKSG